MNVTIDMTLDEVKALEREADKIGMRSFHPHRPTAKWVALHELVALEKAFKAGDQFSAMVALRTCATRELPIPEWAAKFYITAFDTINNYRAKSWDDVLPLALSKGQHLSRARESLAKRFEVLNAVSDLRKAGEPVDEVLFEKVGHDLGLGKTRVSELYYSFHPDFRKLP